MPSAPALLSVTQASQESGCPARTIRYAITHGALKAHKLPGATGSYVINRVDFDAWQRSRTTE
ncbi:helix-turn-helix domain-containing protein [Mycolicibacter kumamotonensis]|uniref:helix-turn-helix domain-containing protein n=1 Tax=Mycolicibacter kumamotonensis TaxID=354243 RepID=UPI000A0404F4